MIHQSTFEEMNMLKLSSLAGAKKIAFTSRMQKCLEVKAKVDFTISERVENYSDSFLIC